MASTGNGGMWPPAPPAPPARLPRLEPDVPRAEMGRRPGAPREGLNDPWPAPACPVK